MTPNNWPPEPPTPIEEMIFEQKIAGFSESEKAIARQKREREIVQMYRDWDAFHEKNRLECERQIAQANSIEARWYIGFIVGIVPLTIFLRFYIFASSTSDVFDKWVFSAFFSILLSVVLILVRWSFKA